MNVVVVYVLLNITKYFWKPIVRSHLFILWLDSPSWPGPPHCRHFETRLTPTTLGRTPPDEWLALPDIKHNTHKRQTSVAPPPGEGFEPVIPASQWPQTHALDRAATVTKKPTILGLNMHTFSKCAPFDSALPLALTFIYADADLLLQSMSCPRSFQLAWNIFIHTPISSNGQIFGMLVVY